MFLEVTTNTIWRLDGGWPHAFESLDLLHDLIL